MNLAPYTKHKDSGVEWLGNVPAHWEMRRLRNVIDMRVSNVDKHIKDGETPVRLCNYVDVYKNDYISEQMTFMRATATDKEIDKFRLMKNDILITKDSETWNDIGVPALVTEPASDIISGYHLAILRPHADEITGRFLHRALQSKGLAYQFHTRANGVTRYGLSHAGIKSVWLPLPPLPEQAAIVRYLDYVERRIQRYVRTKRKLLGLLAEQKQAIIHRAVTRGLDPDAPLKPSGVEWLGDVPTHWEMRRLRNVIDMRVSNVDKHIKEGETPVRLCNYVDVYKNDYISKQMTFMHATATNDEIKRFRLIKDDVLITKDSETWDDIGVPALVTEPASDIISGYHLAILRPHVNDVMGSFLLRALQSKGLAYQFHTRANGVTRYGLSHADIKSVRLPSPPLPEQTTIVEYLDKTTAKIDAAIARTHHEIELINEYRTRLIADVVTGKVDVRDAATKLSDEADADDVMPDSDTADVLDSDTTFDEAAELDMVAELGHGN
ncbi:restriction endonuclease subunit S [Candidatus Spongiihabitans sp.]|uniref:restriction endonuclease subunit S n=1 Tax=Candidatus Spongiihabitans sp. TaxID=3101308 RepID=UPI003C79A131